MIPTLQLGGAGRARRSGGAGGGGIAGDPYFASVTSLLHFGGADASTTMTDVKSISWTANGNAQIDTAQSLFGGSSLLLDGTGDYLTASPAAAFNFGSGDWTIELSVRPAALSASIQTVFTTRGAVPAVGVWIGISTAGLRVVCWDSVGAVLYDQTGGTITDVAWNKIALSRIGGTLKAFINGTTALNAAISGSVGDSSEVNIGRDPGAAGPRNVNGHIDEFRITKGVGRYSADYTVDAAAFLDNAPTDGYFASVELLLHADGTDGGTTFTDSSVDVRTVTRVNAVTSKTQLKFGTAAAYFDGTGDYLTIPYNTTDFKWWDSDFTIEAWVRPSVLAEWEYSGTIPAFIGNADVSAVTIYWTFGPMADGKVRFFYWRGAPESIASTATLAANVWSHIAMTHKVGSGVKLWVNGVGTASYTAVVGTPQQDGALPLAVGQIASAGINGYAEEIRITRGVERYTADFTPPTAPFPDA